MTKPKGKSKYQHSNHKKDFSGNQETFNKINYCGGAWPHRLGLSETILIFQQHVNFVGGYEELAKIIPKIKAVAFEKRLR